MGKNEERFGISEISMIVGALVIVVVVFSVINFVAVRAKTGTIEMNEQIDTIN